MNYESLSLVLKSLADPNRMKIVDVLSAVVCVHVIYLNILILRSLHFLII